MIWNSLSSEFKSLGWNLCVGEWCACRQGRRVEVSVKGLALSGSRVWMRTFFSIKQTSHYFFFFSRSVWDNLAKKYRIGSAATICGALYALDKAALEDGHGPKWAVMPLCGKKLCPFLLMDASPHQGAWLSKASVDWISAPSCPITQRHKPNFHNRLKEQMGLDIEGS